jgi:hypothetical protein
MNNYQSRVFMKIEKSFSNATNNVDALIPV